MDRKLLARRYVGVVAAGVCTLMLTLSMSSGASAQDGAASPAIPELFPTSTPLNLDDTLIATPTLMPVLLPHGDASIHQPIVRAGEAALPAFEGQFLQETPFQPWQYHTLESIDPSETARLPLMTSYPDTDESFRAYQHGLNSVRSLAYSDAVAEFSEAVRLNPQFAEAYLERGRAYYELRDYQNAIASYEEVLRLNPESAAAYSYRGLAYLPYTTWGWDHYPTLDSELFNDLNKAIELDPTSALYRYNLGFAIMRYTLASPLEAFNEAIRLNPTFASAYYQRGYAYYLHGNCPEALNDFTEALRLSPHPKVYWIRGLTYIALQDETKALADFTEAIRRDPQNTLALESRGELYFKQGQYDLSVLDFTTLIQIDPKNAYAYNNRGAALGQQHAYGLALADFEEALHLKVGFNTAGRNRTIALYSLGRVDEALHELQIVGYDYVLHAQIYEIKKDYLRAIEDYTSILDYHPDNIAIRLKRGDAYTELRQYTEALADYDAAIRLDPNSARAYTSRGHVYCGMNQLDQALADYDQSVLLDPNYVLTYYYRACTHKKLGDTQAAFEDYTQVITLDPLHDKAYNGRAYLYFGQGNLEKALADVTMAIQINPTEANYYDSRCEFYLSSGQWLLGLMDCDRAVSLNPNWVFSARMQTMIADAKQRFYSVSATPSPTAVDLGLPMATATDLSLMVTPSPTLVTTPGAGQRG